MKTYFMSQESFMVQGASDVDFTYVALGAIEERAFEHWMFEVWTLGSDSISKWGSHYYPRGKMLPDG